MKELFGVWRDTRAVVMIAVTAALYAAILIPMKIIMPLVPGFTEVRPANVLPILFSFLFGPVAAWGAAFGNVVADCFGTFGPGSIFGFFGNFLYGLIPYKLWRFWSGRVLKWEGDRRVMPQFLAKKIAGYRRTPWPDFGLYMIVSAVASAGCGITIAWGVDMLGFVDFKVLANIILLNNTAMAVILGPPLIASLGRRVRAWGVGGAAGSTGRNISMGRGFAGSVLVVFGCFGGIVVGNVFAASAAAAGIALPILLIPFLLCAFAGAMLL
jgi:energy-coupling factor transport system substrate-specific component